jgi:hypothetical protein
LTQFQGFAKYFDIFTYLFLRKIASSRDFLAMWKTQGESILNDKVRSGENATSLSRTHIEYNEANQTFGSIIFHVKLA